MAEDEKRLDLAERVAARLRGGEGEARSEPQVPVVDKPPVVNDPPAVAKQPRPSVAKAPRAVAAEKPAAGATRRRAANQSSAPGAASIVQIDQGRLYRSGFVVPDGVSNKIAEEFRVIKRPLLLKAFPRDGERDGNTHVMMVTSARPGEGKTFTALNLALSIASEPDLNVLLIDTDTHNTDLEDLIGLKEETGLLDVLTDETLSIADVMLRTSIPNLSIVPCGRRRATETELVASQRMAELTEDIAQRYPDRVVIFDTVPALASSVAGVLALHVGQVVVVIESEVTQRQAIEETTAMVSSCKNVSLLLNKCRYREADSFGYYGYYRKDGASAA